jgi:hypothetical protein
MRAENRSGLDPESNHSATGACEHCPTSYECGKLYMAMSILKAKANESSSEGIVQKIKRFLGKVFAFEFDYPNGKKQCQLVNKEKDVVELTDEAVRILADASLRTENKKSKHSRSM